MLKRKCTKCSKRALASACKIKMILNSMAQDPAEGAAYCNHMLIN